MSDPLTDLLAAVKSGTPLADVLADLLPADEREALDRCAALRLFDRAAFDTACEGLPGDARSRFEAVVAHADVRALGGGRYRMRGAARRRRMERWLAEGGGGVPEWLRTLSISLVDHYESEAARDDIEALYHKLAATPEPAIARMREMFDGAARAFDLALCQDIIDVANDREIVVGPALADELSRMSAHLQARIQWSTAWYRTTSFVPPEGSEATIDALLAPGEPRALELFGADGLGRTAHLQWLIARRCIPKRIACARLDFNDIGDHALVAQEPWLLLLEIARQLDPQLPDAPFRPYLLEYESHALRLHWLSDRVGAKMVAARAPESARDRGRLADGIRESFMDVLWALPDGQRVLVVADSVDPALSPAVSRAGDARLRPAVAELARLVKTTRCVLVAVASRRVPPRGAPRLRQRVPALTLRLAPLTVAEARAYLRTGHRLELDGALEDAALAAARGVPMRLALIADLLKRRTLSVKEVDALLGADELGLAEPILEELSPPLAAALRYGAVPKTLDSEFFHRVLAPFVSSLLETEVDAASVWQELRDFAGASPWLDIAGPDALRFHMLFKRPVREHLRETGEMREFNDRAAIFFRERAEREPDQWGAWMSEALFHEFLHTGTDTAASWRELMRDAQQRDPRHAERLAIELLWLAGGDRGGIADELAAAATEAWIEAAWAAIRAAREAPGRPRGHDAWQRASVALAEIRARQETDQAPSPAQSDALEAALLGRGGQEAAAAALLRKALKHARRDQDRLTLRAELARALERAAPARATVEYRRARRIASRLADATPGVATVDRRLARHLMDRDLYRDARQRCATALEHAARDTRVAAELEHLSAEILLRTGRPSAAAATAWRVITLEAAGARGRHRAGLLSAWTGIATWRPEAAVAQLTGMLDMVEADSGGAPGVEIELRMAQIRELRAQARMRLLDTRGGLEDLEFALVTFEHAGLGSRLRRCLATVAELQLRHLDDVRAAGLILDRLDVAARAAEPVEGIAGELRRIEWLDRTMQGQGLENRLGRIATRLRRAAAPPRQLVAVAIEGLALGELHSPARHIELLTDQLARVQTVGARLLLLEELRRCPQVAEPRDPAAKVLDRLTTSTPDADLPPRDRGMLLLTRADVARICGRREAARRRLEQAREAITGEIMSTYARRRLLEAFDRFDLPFVEESLEMSIEQVAAPEAQTTPHPSSAAALLIQSALQALRAGTTDESVDRLLESAEKLLSQPHADEKWLAALHEAREEAAALAGDERAARRHRARADVLRFRLDEHASSPGADGSSAEAEVAVRVELRRRPGGLGVRVGGSPERERVAAGDLGMLFAKPERASVDELVDWVARASAQFVTVAAAALFTPEVVAALNARDERGQTLAVSSRDRRAHAFPWELALCAAPPEVQALVGGIERTVPAMAPVAPAASGAAARITLFIPPPAGAGLRARAARPIEDRYRAAGWEVAVEHGFSPAALERAVTGRAPAVVHVASSLVFYGGTAMLDLGAGSVRGPGREPSQELLTASRLARAPRSSERPLLLVLDPPGVSGVRETARQLLLRNLLAAELLVLVARPVLCTGIVRHDDRDTLSTLLVDGLTADADLRALARGLSAATRDSMDMRDGFATTALFMPSAPFEPP